MNFDYKIRLDQYGNKYIQIPFSYKDSNITIEIYQHFITASGIDEQALFYFCKHLNLENLDRNNIKFKIKNNNIFLYFKCYMNNDFTIYIKHVKNKLFFKLYKNNILSKRSFCYINKENKKIYENSAHTVFKHLLNHKNKSKYDLKKISENEIYIINTINKEEKFFVSIFDKDILEIKYIYNDKNKTQYKYTYDSLYCINNFKFLDFLVGVEEVPVEEIEQIKLSRKLNKF
tara:strand:- start:1401 stop:2093 length:693 start_codon:yes stop_codon:yes gene_type:complete